MTQIKRNTIFTMAKRDSIEENVNIIADRFSTLKFILDELDDFESDYDVLEEMDDNLMNEYVAFKDTIREVANGTKVTCEYTKFSFDFGYGDSLNFTFRADPLISCHLHWTFADDGETFVTFDEYDKALYINTADLTKGSVDLKGVFHRHDMTTWKELIKSKEEFSKRDKDASTEINAKFELPPLKTLKDKKIPGEVIIALNQLLNAQLEAAVKAGVPSFRFLDLYRYGGPHGVRYVALLDLADSDFPIDDVTGCFINDYLDTAWLTADTMLEKLTGDLEGTDYQPVIIEDRPGRKDFIQIRMKEDK